MRIYMSNGNRIIKIQNSRERQKNQYWEEDAGLSAPFQLEDQRFFVPILSDKRSIDQKIRSLKERTANGQFKGILFGRKK
ncbi:Protein CBG09589 [Caenorhabditis briggsae]|uniref:Protein CBG09589 n=1 Tax=Caenorhabditis briggsae TaxID=6238 RepID=A8X8Q8_CAEBR|nr:Protein CBG09589 [Caenorhabditis briggsae]CAP29019.2 Protein CBG09589 [Caenorhabditis briggsae]